MLSAEKVALDLVVALDSVVEPAMVEPAVVDSAVVDSAVEAVGFRST